jgi:hypothetical protein
MLAESLAKRREFHEAAYVFDKAFMLLDQSLGQSLAPEIVQIDAARYAAVLMQAAPNSNIGDVLAGCLKQTNIAVRGRIRLGLAKWHLWKRDFKKAEEALKVSVDLHRKAYGAKHEWTATVACLLADCYLRRDKATEAMRLLKPYNTAGASAAASVSLRQCIVSLLARCHYDQGRVREAEELMREVDWKTGKSSPSVLLSKYHCYVRKGMRETADQIFSVANMLQECVWDTPEDTLFVLIYGAALDSTSGRMDDLRSAVWRACVSEAAMA